MAAAGTYVEYGNVRIHRCVTRSFDQVAVFDESGTDLLYSKFTIRVSGYLHGHDDWSYFHQLPYVNDGTGATGAHKGVRYQLPPRLAFKMAVGAASDGTPSTSGGQPIVLLEANPAPANMIPPPSQYANINLQNVDLANGPKCLEFSVSHITGNELFAVDATFEVCKLECNPDGSCPYNSYGVLSNRWSVEDSLDANLQTTRTYTGQLVVASANLQAHQLRWIVAPPLAPAFRRDRMHFAVSADGLRLNWTITDQEISASAPYPATKWSVRHTVRSNQALMGTSSIDIALEGKSNVNKADLIEIALYVICNKLLGRNPQQLNALAPEDYIVESVEFTDHIGDVAMITASAQVRKTCDVLKGVSGNFLNLGMPIKFQHLPAPNDGTEGGLGGLPLLDAGGDVIGYQGDTGGGHKYHPSVSWGGYAGQVPAVEGPARIVGLFACYLQTPCNNVHGLVNTSTVIPSQNVGSLSESSQLSQNIPYTATYGDSTNPTQNSTYSTSHQAKAYLFWQVDNIYRRRSMRIQMPIATAPTTAYDATSSFVKLAGDQIFRVLRVHAERVGADPEFFDPETGIPPWPVPDPVPTGWKEIKQYYLKHTIRPGKTTDTVTGQSIHRATMEIVIGLSRPPSSVEKLAIGNDKWTNLGAQSTAGLMTGTW